MTRSLTATGSDPRPHRHGEIVRVFVAACTGAARLTGDIGLPVVHIDAALDVEAAISSLNARQHGCGVRWPGSFQPLKLERGWDDWALFAIEPVVDLVTSPFGVQVCDGCFLVHLPAGTPLAEFRGHLAGALRHLRLQDATIRADFLQARCDAMADMVIHPRYTPACIDDLDFRHATVVEDMFVIDPAENGIRLFWLIVAARAAAAEGRSKWR